MIVGIVVGTGLVFLLSRTCRFPAREVQTIYDARVTATAVDVYTSENQGCPTVRDLVEAGIFARERRLTDAWDHDFRIVCEKPEVLVQSAGPDGRFGTPDDVTNRDEVRKAKSAARRR